MEPSLRLLDLLSGVGDGFFFLLLFFFLLFPHRMPRRVVETFSVRQPVFPPFLFHHSNQVVLRSRLMERNHQHTPMPSGSKVHTVGTWLSHSKGLAVPFTPTRPSPSIAIPPPSATLKRPTLRPRVTRATTTGNSHSTAARWQAQPSTLILCSCFLLRTREGEQHGSRG